MEFTNTFTIPVGIDDAFTTLTDLETVAPCMPGAKLETVEGDVYTGKVKVKVGPMSLTYRGTAEMVEKDLEDHTAKIAAKGNEARGGGTANADVSASLVEVDDGTEVTVVTALNITGKPAQFGRGVMADVGKKIIDTFAECLSRKVTEADLDLGADEAAEEEAEAGEEAAEPVAAAAEAEDGEATAGDEEPAAAPVGATPAEATVAAEEAVAASGPRRVADTAPEVEALDLMEVAGDDMIKRAAPAIGIAVLVALVIWLFRRGKN